MSKQCLRMIFIYKTATLPTVFLQLSLELYNVYGFIICKIVKPQLKKKVHCVFNLKTAHGPYGVY